MAFDIVITSPLQSKFLFKSASESKCNAAIEAAEYRKDSHSLAICEEQGFDFTPLAFDTFGGYGKTVATVMNRLIIGAADKTGVRRATIASQFRQRISLAIQRVNANMLVCHSPVCA